MVFLEVITDDVFFTCTLTQEKRLECQSGGALGINIGFEFEPWVTHWYIFILRSSQEGTDMSIRALDMSIINSGFSEAFFPDALESMKPTEVTLGGRTTPGDDGIIGSMRNF